MSNQVITSRKTNKSVGSEKVVLSESQKKSQELFMQLGKSNPGNPVNGRDVLNTPGLEWWADRYVDLVESLDGKPGAKYSVNTANSTLVSMYYLYEKLCKDADKFSNSTSDNSRALALMNNRLQIGRITESLNAKSNGDVKVLLSESNFGSNITTTNIQNPAFSVIDMVGLFFPSSVLNYMTDLVPLPQKYNQVYRMIPRYGQSGGGVDAGQIIFQTITNGTYASVYRLNTFAPAFAATAPHTQLLSLSDQQTTTPIVAVPRSIYITVSYTSLTVVGKVITEVFRDDGQGNLVTISTGFTTSNLNMGASSVAYQVATVGGDGHQTRVTLALNSLEVAVGPDDFAPSSIQATYLYDYEIDDFNDTQIRTVNLDIETVQLVAFAHPLRLAVAVEMEFEVKSIADVSVLDSAQQTSVGLIAMERDINYINNLSLSALNSQTLTFDASGEQYYPVTAKYTTFINTLMQADNLIKNTMGRGELTTLVVGPQTRTILMSCPFFEPAKTNSTIGFQFLGTLMNGQVSVIYNPFLNPSAQQETFLAYFKGFGPGDAPVIHGDWLPFYLTPEITMYDLNSYQAVASYYVQQINPWVTSSTLQPGSYVWAGTITGFGS